MAEATQSICLNSRMQIKEWHAIDEDEMHLLNTCIVLFLLVIKAFQVPSIEWVVIMIYYLATSRKMCHLVALLMWMPQVIMSYVVILL